MLQRLLEDLLQESTASKTEPKSGCICSFAFVPPFSTLFLCPSLHLRVDGGLIRPLPYLISKCGAVPAIIY